MKIGKPVSETPGPGGVHGSRYDEIYQKALALNGRFLPVKCDDLKEALLLIHAFYNAKAKGKSLGLAARRRGNTVYIYKP